MENNKQKLNIVSKNNLILKRDIDMKKSNLSRKNLDALLFANLQKTNTHNHGYNTRKILNRMANTIGYIKFVDKEYIDSFFKLNSLWLSNINYFTLNDKRESDDLINDKFEGKLHNLVLDMPAFITSFTEVNKNFFTQNGILREDISNSLIKSEKQLGKNRSFVFIPYDNMQHLLKVLNECQSGKKEGVLTQSSIFSRKILYINNYTSKMEQLENEYFNGTKTIEDVAKGLLGIKSSKYQLQNEFRLGFVYPQKNSAFINKHKHVNGITIGVEPSFTFATRKFEWEALQGLNIQQLQ